MNDSTLTASTAGGQSNNANISEAVIRIAGNSQDGIQSIGGFLARLAGRSEQEVMTFMTIPSTISGGPSIFQVRIGTGEVLSAGDEADVLLAFYQHSYEGHIDSLVNRCAPRRSADKKRAVHLLRHLRSKLPRCQCGLGILMGHLIWSKEWS